MKFFKEEHEVLKKILCRAYYEKERVKVSDHWQHGVMRRIRNLGPVEPDASFFIRFEQLVWRLTPVVCPLILILATVLFRAEIVPKYGVFQLLLNGEEELSISQFVGL